MADTATKVPVKSENKASQSTATVPWAPFDSLRREIDRLFEAVSINPWGLSLARPTFPFEMPWSRQTSWAVNPAVDISEKDGEFEISAELPGMTEKNIDVKLSNGNLVIKGEKSEEKEEDQKDYHLSERRYGSFVRSFAVPEGVEADKIEATFTNGVLKIKLPKNAKLEQTPGRSTSKPPPDRRLRSLRELTLSFRLLYLGGEFVFVNEPLETCYVGPLIKTIAIVNALTSSERRKAATLRGAGRRKGDIVTSIRSWSMGSTPLPQP